MGVGLLCVLEIALAGRLHDGLAPIRRPSSARQLALIHHEFFESNLDGGLCILVVGCIEQPRLLVAFEPSVALIEVLGPAHTVHRALGDRDVPAVDGHVARSRKDVDLTVDRVGTHGLAPVFDVVVDGFRHYVGKGLANETGRRSGQSNALARLPTEVLACQGRVRVLVSGKGVSQVNSGQTGISQHGIDDVALDLETLVTRRLLAQVARK